MKEEISDEELIELLEGSSNPDLESRIADDPQLKKRLDELAEILSIMENVTDNEVPDHIQGNLQTAILQEELKTGSRKPWMQIAAAVVFLIVGFGLGRFGQRDQSLELASLQGEIQSLREITLTSALQKHSASERILAVNRIEEKSAINEELLAALIGTLNSDESPNVRYAALQALGKYILDEKVRTELVKSLEAQTDVLIQISLINMLVEAEERSVIAPLKELLDKESTMPEVKRQAEVALKILT